MYCPECGKEQTGYPAYCIYCGTRLPLQQYVQAKSYPDEIVYAGFWKRFAAHLIDQILIGIVCTIIFYIGGFIIGIMFFEDYMIFDTMTTISVGLLFILYILIPWLYYAIMESSSKQGTLGKMLIGIIVTDLKGDKISFSRATGRYFSKYLSYISLYIGFIIIAFTVKKQGLHDIVANTLVIDKKLQ